MRMRIQSSAVSASEQSGFGSNQEDGCASFQEASLLGTRDGLPYFRSIQRNQFAIQHGQADGRIQLERNDVEVHLFIRNGKLDGVSSGRNECPTRSGLNEARVLR